MATWPENVNNKFYGLDGKADENRVQIKFKSGRVIYHKINTIVKKSYAVKLQLNDSIKTDGKTEFERFLAWFENENGSGTIPVELTDIEAKTGTKEYYVTLSNWNGQKNKELSIELEEV
jgi:hypothetical protein